MPEPDDQPPKARPKRKWRRRLAWTGVVLAGIGFAVNGPIARWGAGYALDQALESQGMQGNAKVDGSLLRGFSIRNLSYSGEQGIQLLEIEHLAVEYRIRELLDNRIRILDASDAKVVLDVAKFPPSEEEPEDPHARLRDTLSAVRSWVIQPDIAIQNLDLDIRNKGEEQAHFSLGKLEHSSGSSLIQLKGFEASDNSGNSTPKQQVNITWDEFSATIDHFEVFPKITLKDVVADWQSSPRGAGSLLFHDAELDIAVGESISAVLKKGIVSTTQITEQFGIELPISTSLTAFQAELSNWYEQPTPLWYLEATVSAEHFHYDIYQAKDLGLKITQHKGKNRLDLTAELNGTALTAQTEGQWLKPESDKWWMSMDLDYSVSSPKLGDLVSLWYTLPEGIQTADASAKAEGELSLRETSIDKATLRAGIEGIKAKKSSIPPLTLSAEYSSEGSIKTTLTSGERISAQASYNLDTQNYQGKLDVNEETTDWLNAICEIFEVGIQIKAPLDLSWDGTGNVDIKKPQTGILKIGSLNISNEEIPNLTASANVSYDWPKSLSVDSLQVSEGEWNGSAKLNWDGSVVTIEKVQIRHLEEQVASIHGELPYNVELDSLKKFLSQGDEWNLNVDTKKLALQKIHQWFSIDQLERFNGNVEVDFKLAGTPKSPTLDGKLSILGFKGLDDEYLSPLDLTTRFSSDKDQLNLQALLLEEKTERIKLEGSFPFTPEEWLEDPNLLETLLNKSPINATLNVAKLPVDRFKKFIPQLKEIQGSISAQATVTGTIHEPKYKADINAEIPVLKLGFAELRDVRNIKLNTKLTESLVADLDLTAQINGGAFKVSGNADLNEIKNPSFDINLSSRYALVHRDDLISVRANTDLTLKGNLENATLGGRIGIVESLIYKDIELIPIGVPSSAVAEVKLPTIDPERADNGLPIPEPFGNWKLDLTVFTQDPILARGNIASGYINGSIKVGGTLQSPAPDGKLNIRNVKAKLPFSVLEIPNGTVVFTPAGGLIPSLDIRGKSSIGNYDVNVFVYGSAASPKTAFSSYPPLPESEVMALIATGSTTSGLENQEVATFKAFQIFLLKMRQRAEAPGGNKLFAALLKGVENLNLNVGDKNTFTGKEYYSATIELTPSWHLTAQVDNEQQTRGLVIYVIRFR